MSDRAPTATPETAVETVPAGEAEEIDAAALRSSLALEPGELAAAAAGPDAHELLGQERALEAVKLAIGIDGPGYNVFVTGLRSRNERNSITRLLEEKAASMPTPGDWVYVYNFRSPEAPRAICLRPGQGPELRERMNQLVAFLVDQLPKAFRHEDFEQERAALRQKYNKRAQELFSGLESEARARGFAIQGAPTGQILVIPLIDGKMPESPDALATEMAKKSEEERERLNRAQGELQSKISTLLLRQQEMMHELIGEIREIERSFASRLIAPALDELKAHFREPALDTYLDEVRDHMLSHLDRFRAMAEKHSDSADGARPMLAQVTRSVEYEVNVMVDNTTTRGAPVVNETAPTYRNLFGTIERWIDPLGRAGTNFTRIVGGSLLKSDGGFLVFDLEDAVTEPGVWHSLKRTLKSGRMTLETFEPIPFLAVSGLRPEPIAIRNKVVVLGSPYLYNLLYFYDQDFADLFKVKAEMRPAVDAGKSAERYYAARAGALARREGLPPFDGEALARIVAFGMRMAGDRDRVLAMMEPVDDLSREAAFFARERAAGEVLAEDVDRALNERILRLNFIEEEIRRLIQNGTLIVHVEGRSIGQINGLAVMDVGGYAFGRPARVTATVALGRAGVINIEREARLSGSTHDKGIMILSAFLRARFGQDHPLAMSASICFEQSYSGIDGDSASSTELYALLSALSRVPLRQDLAVTGSVDQYGNVQAIGGVNEKIEGFYRTCKAVGLTGHQGVIVPRSNVRNLMLDSETVEGVADGRFHIYPVDTIAQGIELLTGVRAGTIDDPGTIDYLVHRRLSEMAEALRERPVAETRVVQEPAPHPQPPRPPEPPTPQR